MRSAVILTLVAPALCVDVSLSWRHEKPTGITSLSVYNATNDLIGQSCSGFINGSVPIDFEVTDDGFGNFTIGNKTFLAHHLPDISGGPICATKFNQVAAAVECSGLEWDSSGAKFDINCHSHAEAKALMAHFRG
jgi:hypothetical protein